MGPYGCLPDCAACFLSAMHKILWIVWQYVWYFLQLRLSVPSASEALVWPQWAIQAMYSIILYHKYLQMPPGLSYVIQVTDVTTVKQTIVTCFVYFKSMNGLQGGYSRTFNRGGKCEVLLYSCQVVYSLFLFSTLTEFFVISYFEILTQEAGLYQTPPCE